ncbi:glutaredoxin family protein [Paenibacillus koleovorans]|uniref:glutaredoxin family protein n=1 Tax=Paenibacillus koleovorans TaxID=121608 RepID=UPI000FD856A6|nr:glutaredoxin domain-containing protein [Paenibacillus koleovorans]
MKLYTKTICPKCLWIKSEVQRSGLEVEIVNIDHDAAAHDRLVEAGVMSVPVMEVDGQYIFDPNEMVKQMERMAV